MKIVKVTRIITYTGPEKTVIDLSKASFIPSQMLSVKITDTVVGLPQIVGSVVEVKTKSPEGAEG